jgi:hypothetical protein
MMRRFRVLHFLWLCVCALGKEGREIKVNQSATLTKVLVLLLHVLTSNPAR